MVVYFKKSASAGCGIAAGSRADSTCFGLFSSTSTREIDRDPAPSRIAESQLGISAVANSGGPSRGTLA